ncbi:MAG: sulfotransferase domain-containing protein [Phycisphaerae bacterium]
MIIGTLKGALLFLGDSCMLVMANGAFKSGSTWLRNIILEMMEFQPIPESYRHPDYLLWISSYRLADFLREVDFQNHNFISKGHLHSHKYVDLLLSHPDVRVFDITRDVRDVIVSHYYHMVREGKVKSEFGPYYWKLGRYKAYQIVEYHKLWSVDHPQMFVSSFESLKTDFHNEVRRIGSFLGCDLSEEDIDRIKDKTSLQRLREKRGEEGVPEEKRFYRKGIIGDWQNHFDDDMARDIERIQESGLSGLSRLKYQAFFKIRPAVKAFFSRRSTRMRRLMEKV